MARAKLTDRFVASVKAPPKGRLEVFDQDVRGLILRVGPTGKKSWVFRYRTADGVQRRYALGIFLNDLDQSETETLPEGDAKRQALSLFQARALARDLINKVGVGQDPSSRREHAIEEARAEPIKSFNDLKDAYFKAVETGEWRPREKPKKASTIVRERQMWAAYIDEPMGELALTDVTAPRIKGLLRDLVAKGNGTTSNRVRALLRQILNFGLAEDKLIANPVDKVKALAPERVRDRVLSDAEIKSIWEVLEDPTGLLVPDLNPKKPYQSLQVSEHVRLILKLLLLTLARRSEVAGMRIDELNLEQSAWTISGNRTKNGKANFIPLSPQAKSVIERALELRQQLGLKDSPFVFASPRGTQTAITSNPVSHGMRDICRAIGIEGATTHDLRRTAATNMASERLKIPPFLIGRILNHSGETGGAAAVTMKVYALYDYAAEKREALGKWGELVAQIIKPQQPKK